MYRVLYNGIKNLNRNGYNYLILFRFYVISYKRLMVYYYPYITK